jgi:hypothetical protein
MKPTVIEIRVYPFEVPAGVVKVAVGELAFKKDHFVQNEGLTLEVLIPVGFHVLFS